MEDFKNNIIYICLIYINMFFIMIVMKKCFKINNFSYGFFTFMFILASIIYCFYSSLLKRFLYRLLFILLIILFSLLFIYYNTGYLMKLYNLNIKYVTELNNSIYNGEMTAFYQFKVILAIIIPLLMFLTLWISNKVWSNFILLITTSSMVFFWHYGYTEAIKKYTPYFIIISIITYCISTYMSNIDDLKYREVKIFISSKKIVVYVVMISFFITVVQGFLPKEIGGKYNRESAKKIINKFSTNRRDLENVYNISSSGYTNTDKKLGGPITIDNKEVFKVKADRPYYLRGISKEYYDGFSWKGIQNNYERVDKNNYALEPKGSNILSILGESKVDYITIYPKYINTSTLFAPMYTTGVDIKGEKVFYDKDNNFIASNDINKEYTVKFYNDNLKYSVMSNNIYNKKNIITTIMDYGYKRSLSLEPEKFKEYDVYLQLPDNIPKRVFDLVKNITKGEKDPGEKVFRIYQYLNENYKYSLEVPPLSDGKEFVDNFLFKEKRGYCTYFATAATIMCRIAGIPARYVEGFNMTYDKDTNGLFIVSNKNAHAWSEVLIDPLSNSWSILDTVPSAPDEIQRDLEKQKENVNQGSAKIEEHNKNNIKKTEEKTIEKEEIKNYKEWYFSSLFGLLLLMLFSIIVRILIIVNNRRKVIKAKSIIPLYLYIISRLKSIGIYKNENEGDKEFIQNIEDVSLKFKMEEIIEHVYIEFYGEKQNIIEYNEKEELYEFIEKYIKENQGRGKYYTVKFFRRIKS